VAVDPAVSGRRARWVEASGAVLALSYPVLALSTGTRAAVQLGRALPELALATPAAWLFAQRASLMSGVAAVCYLLAAVGFAVRSRTAWRVSVACLLFETVMALTIGTWSIVAPELIGRTVWRLYGIDYGFFPLFQPALGLMWLFWPPTRASYDAPRAPAANGAA
jgi:hypothetical protein